MIVAAVDAGAAIRSTRRMRRVVLLWALFVVGCSSSSDGPASVASPAEECDALLSTYCGRAADCIEQVGCDPGVSRDDENQACLTAARQTLDCLKARSIKPSYTDCLNATRATECSAFGTAAQCMAPTLATDCQGVILF